MIQDNNEQVTQNVEVSVESPVEQAQEMVNELSNDQLYNLSVMNELGKLNNWKKRVSGYAKLSKPARLSRSWHNGELILSSERAQLSWEEVHASNNVIKKAK